MEKLLRWSVNATNSNRIEEAPDPKLLAQLFGAPDDRMQMKENLRAAMESHDEQVQIECLEKFEELIENIDNANSIGNLWSSLLYLANSPKPGVRRCALSIIGTAVQNNEKAQLDLANTPDGIATLMEHLNDADSACSVKALYALASSIAHCSAAYELFTRNKGWELLEYSFLKDRVPGSVDRLRARQLSLLYALALIEPHEPVFERLKNTDLVDRMLVLYPTDNSSVNEKILDVLKLLKKEGFKSPKLDIFNAADPSY